MEVYACNFGNSVLFSNFVTTNNIFLIKLTKQK